MGRAGRIRRIPAVLVLAVLVLLPSGARAAADVSARAEAEPAALAAAAAAPERPPAPGVADASEGADAPLVSEASDAVAAPRPAAGPDDPGLWVSWALLDRATGRHTGSANATTDRTNAESTIKAWIAADSLRAAAAAGRPLSRAEHELVSRAVRGSDDDAAEALYRDLGGDAVLERLGPSCGVAVHTSRAGWWSYAQITALDAAMAMDCVLRLAPRWPGGARLADDLRSVDNPGRSGIDGLLPGGAVLAEKNGWTRHSSTGWNVNCVVAWNTHVLAVLTRFPADRTEDYGWGVCRDVAADALAAAAR